jgi:hypothetical protein
MVLFTVCYMVATGVQTWRLRTIYTKVAKIMESKNSVVFLKNSDGLIEGEKYFNYFVSFSGS